MSDVEEIRQRLEKQVDLIIECGSCGAEMTTVINLVDGSPELVRQGCGPLAPLGLD